MKNRAKHTRLPGLIQAGRENQNFKDIIFGLVRIEQACYNPTMKVGYIDEMRFICGNMHSQMEEEEKDDETDLDGRDGLLRLFGDGDVS